MSITKLKTVGSWTPRGVVRARDEAPGQIRGRVITGLLTGEDEAADDRGASPGPRAPRQP